MKKTLAKVFGVVFVLVGILGFFGNPIVGAEGYFHADMMHNIVHIVLGLVLFLFGGKEESAGTWLKIVGVVYLLVAVLGFVMVPGLEMGETGKLLNLIEINGADNWLHVVLGVVVFFAGFMGGKSVQMPMGNTPQQM
ncbi:MAG: DUF4383 domain-containing protein [Candidatus Pacebacteria bacterium]|nr:DUF4383 domain-containing protein [Candidatus Paceibacterota bacterium]